jgi:Rieske Fe-S protein
MNRRSVLKWISAVLTSLCAAIVALPGVSYVLGSMRRRSGEKLFTRRVARLAELPPGKPVQVPIRASRTDAWTAYPEEVVGRVWLVRRSDAQTPPDQTRVEAFSSVCPHLGCSIEFAAGQSRFVCPCHRAAFALDGRPLSAKELGHRNNSPRDMDSLQCRLVQHETTQDWWVEVVYEQFEPGLTRKLRKA